MLAKNGSPASRLDGRGAETDAVRCDDEQPSNTPIASRSQRRRRHWKAIDERWHVSYEQAARRYGEPLGRATIRKWQRRKCNPFPRPAFFERDDGTAYFPHSQFGAVGAGGNQAAPTDLERVQ